MKSKTITHIILEGCDGIGKDTICKELWRKFDFKQRVYIRGEISDYVYAKKYNREFVSTQRQLPFLYVVLYASEYRLQRQLLKRSKEHDYSIEETCIELSTIKDQKLFKSAVKQMKNDYHILEIDIKDLNVKEIANLIYSKCMQYINNLPYDEHINSFNDMYTKGCQKLNISVNVRNNQPYFNNTMIMADAQLHNGKYETYTDKTVPHNLLFSLAYKNVESFTTKIYDFCYPINSKILVRKEVYDYIQSFDKANLTLLTTDSKYIPNYNCIRKMPKVFGDDYINYISQARATIYTSRDLAYLEMMTVRAYEAVLANQVIFVDKLTDKQNKILKQIFTSTEDKFIINLLSVDETTIAKHFKKVFSNKALVNYILRQQHCWYNKLVEELKNKGETLCKSL